MWLVSTEAVDLTNLENRWNVDEISCSLRTEVPANSVSGYGNAQQTLAKTQCRSGWRLGMKRLESRVGKET